MRITRSIPNCCPEAFFPVQVSAKKGKWTKPACDHFDAYHAFWWFSRPHFDTYQKYPKVVWEPGVLAMLSSYRKHGRKYGNHIRTQNILSEQIRPHFWLYDLIWQLSHHLCLPSYVKLAKLTAYLGWNHQTRGLQQSTEWDIHPGGKFSHPGGKSVMTRKGSKMSHPTFRDIYIYIYKWYVSYMIYIYIWYVSYMM